jgi:tetratricopeptide (TPR) repeat protein
MSSLHQRAKDLFLEALARPAPERDRFLADACGSDAPLREEVDSLLAFHSDGDGGSDLPAGDPVNDHGSEVRFTPGQIFAGRYRMETVIGHGGMGDVWRADDLVLQTPVALKLMRPEGSATRDRLLNEVRLARQITDPAICRVFDVGEAEGQVFFSMELVEGEDLATLLRRVGRLPSERVIAIGRRLCAGLAAAHAQGVLHRDLKPANVLIDDNGRVLITDFGIAVSRSGAHHTLIGTPGYMAPEQMVEGAALSERTDLYALGLVLYEALVGQHPSTPPARPLAPARPSKRFSDVNLRLERAILRALSPDPRDRPESASAMAAILAEAEDIAPLRRRSRWVAVATAIAVLAVLALAASFLATARRSPALSATDTIVLADFANSTGEPVFDGALKVALAVSLEQSPFLKVFPDERVKETLRLMGRPAETPVTRSIAREVAQREQLKALLTGSIERLGRNYVIALEAINAQTGDSMARQQIEVGSKEDVLTALGASVSRMRGTLGESLASIQQFDAPLARATTSSLEALHAYSLALDQGSANPRLEAIPHLKRAVELDPDFALALAFMATVYANNGQTANAAPFATKAFNLRDRVSERERFFITFRYYRDATQDWDRALELTRAWTTAYPREAFAHNSLGTALLRFGRYELSLEPFRRAIALDPSFSPPHPNLATSLIALNRFEEARAILQQAAARKMDSGAIRRLSYTLTFLDGDAAKTDAHWQSWAGPRDALSFGYRAHISAAAGRIRLAHEEFRTGIQLALGGGLHEVAGQLAVEDAESHAIAGQCTDAVHEVEEAIGWSRDNFTLERGSRAAALCKADREVAALARELSDRFPEATFTVKVAVPITTAAAAAARGEPARALERLDVVRPYDLTQRAELWPAYLRAVSYLALRQGPAAAEQFLSVIARRGEDPDSPLYALAHLGLARAALLAGDTTLARTKYQEFFGLWKDADLNLEPLRAARRELGALP